MLKIEKVYKAISDKVNLFIIAVFFVSCFTNNFAQNKNFNINDNTSNNLAIYTGNFGEGDITSDDVVTFTQRRGTLLMGPALWSGPMVLQNVKADSFVVAAHPRFSVKFIKDNNGIVNNAHIYGLSKNNLYTRLDEKSQWPVQYLLSGHPVKAAKKYVETDPSGVKRFATVGTRYVVSHPTDTKIAIDYYNELNKLIPGNSELLSGLGYALIFGGDRIKATEVYKKVLSIDSSNSDALTALKRLGVIPQRENTGWKLPFKLDSLFSQPRRDEIQSVWNQWEKRNLEPEGIKVILKKEIDLNGVKAEAWVVSHLVHGQRHLGVIIIPDAVKHGSAPVVVEAKGVSPDFFPLVIPDGLTSPLILGDARNSVIYVAPGYRGENIIIGSDTLTSEGDRSDAWDGATDDLIAFLKVALKITPEADTNHICVFGRSRGGTVALLSGIRDKSIGCVVSWAAPTDWFSLMGQEGWTQRELVEDGLRNKSTLFQTAGQFIKTFLKSAIKGEENLEQVRLHIIASSPLYFASHLSLAQVNWGIEDPIVPIINGKEFVARYKKSGRSDKCLEVHFYPDAGHDQDRQLAPIFAKEFILKAFKMNKKELEGCKK